MLHVISLICWHRSTTALFCSDILNSAICISKKWSEFSYSNCVFGYRLFICWAGVIIFNWHCLRAILCGQFRIWGVKKTLIPLPRTIILWCNDQKQITQKNVENCTVISNHNFLGRKPLWYTWTKSRLHLVGVKLNSCHHSYHRFWRVNEANGSFSFNLTRKPRLHAALNKTRFACRLNCNIAAISHGPQKT